MGKTTLRDVADLSGFSVTTVSYVLNDVPGKRIPAATRDVVLAAARTLSYSPNRLAQGLRLQRTNTLGFVGDHVANSPHAGQTIQGAQDAAAARGSLLMLMNTGADVELENREIRALRDRQVDGIVYAAEYHRVLVPPAALDGLPAVLLDARSEDGRLPSVVPDEAGGAAVAVAELLERGHRRIGFLNDTDDIPASTLRLAGYRQALEAAGVGFDPARVAVSDSDARGGYRAAGSLLAAEPGERPSALFCFNDRMAMGAYQAAHEVGLRVPQDLSVIGFDNQELIAASLRPGLTTVALPHYEMGRWAADVLLDAIEGEGVNDPRHATLPCPLVRRESVARAPD
ncbi:LacI family DNA-binding transcriptional regulator [Salana multivorans]